MNIVNLTYDSTNYYLLEYAEGYIMIDTGWAGTFGELQKLLKQKNIELTQIKYLIITHFHPDHAGLAEEHKEHGTKLLVHQAQTEFIGELKKYFKPRHEYKEINEENNLVLSSEKSREFLKEKGIEGEIIHTPGHSDDSVTLIIDGLCAFTGDLPPVSMGDVSNMSKLKDSWNKIKSYNVKTIYPGHGKTSNLYY